MKCLDWSSQINRMTKFCGQQLFNDKWTYWGKANYLGFSVILLHYENLKRNCNGIFNCARTTLSTIAVLEKCHWWWDVVPPLSSTRSHTPAEGRTVATIHFAHSPLTRHLNTHSCFTSNDQISFDLASERTALIFIKIRPKGKRLQINLCNIIPINVGYKYEIIKSRVGDFTLKHWYPLIQSKWMHSRPNGICSPKGLAASNPAYNC